MLSQDKNLHIIKNANEEQALNILNYMREEYKLLNFDIPNKQIGIINKYITLNIALITAVVAIFVPTFSGEKSLFFPAMEPDENLLLATIASLTLSLISVMLSVKALQENKHIKKDIESKNNSNIKEIYFEYIKNYHNQLIDSNKKNEETSKVMTFAFWILLLSFISAILAFLFATNIWGKS